MIQGIYLVIVTKIDNDPIGKKLRPYPIEFHAKEDHGVRVARLAKALTVLTKTVRGQSIHGRHDLIYHNVDSKGRHSIETEVLQVKDQDNVGLQNGCACDAACNNKEMIERRFRLGWANERVK